MVLLDRSPLGISQPWQLGVYGRARAGIAATWRAGDPDA